jgi:hypothetical protein
MALYSRKLVTKFSEDFSIREGSVAGCGKLRAGLEYFEIGSDGFTEYKAMANKRG